MASTPAERRTLIAVLGFLVFAAVYAQIAMAPVLSSIAEEFGVTTGVAGLVIAAYGVPGILLGLLAGPYSDRFGRKPFLVGGSLVLGAFTILASFAPTFGLLVLVRAFAGAGASVIFPNLNAVIADAIPYHERGRAIGITVALNTLAAVVGVPVAGLLADAVSWRLSLGLTGVFVLVAALLLVRRLPADRSRGEVRANRALYATVLSSASAVAALGVAALSGLFWFAWSTYLVVFLQHSYDLGVGPASVLALTNGLGVMIGSLAGGRFSERAGYRPVAYRTLALGGVMLFVILNVPLPLPLEAVAITVASTVMGIRFTANQALMTELVPAARGTMLAAAFSLQNVGLVVAAAGGGLIVDRLGFGALGFLCLGAALVGSLVLRTFVVERAFEPRRA